MMFFVYNKLKELFISDSPQAVSNESRELYSTRFYADQNIHLQDEIKRTGVEGIVTFVDDNLTGRIDGYINFDSSSVITYTCKEKKITVGSEVDIDIERHSKISPWFVRKMTVLSFVETQTNDWDDFETKGNCKIGDGEIIENLPVKQVGMVTSVYNQEIVVNNDIHFHQSDCGENSFRPYEGDWVIIQFDHLTRINQVIGIWPLRYIDFEGCISNFNGNVGYIDKTIFFSKYIIRGESLRRGNYVYGTAIESVQGRRCNFRAVSIFKKTNDISNKSLNMRIKSINLNFNIVKPEIVGLTLSDTSVNFGQLNITESSVKTIVITNHSDHVVKLLNIRLSSETNDQFLLENDDDDYDLAPKVIRNIKIKCTPQFPGFDSQKIFIEGIDQNDSKWTIMIDVSVYIFDYMANKISSPENNDRSDNSEINIKGDNKEYTAGVHLPAAKPLKISSVLTKMYPHNLKLYPVPKELDDRIERKEDIFAYYNFLTETLSPGNYANKMNFLVHLEEINTKNEMKQFIIEGVRLLPRRDTFCIEVPGLSEGRPSLMLGDKVLVIMNESHGSSYSGNIEEILCESIFVKFHPTFHSTYSNEVCNVTFQHSRLPFRRMHLGVEMACGSLGDVIIFPNNIVIKTSQCVRLSRGGINEFSAINFMKEEKLNLLQLKFYNESLNELQRVAVLRILHGYSRPLPYVLFGPPGTGKTVTLVETILQIYKNVPSSRILLCAPSNSASDLLCLRLHESGVIKTGEMVRMNAFRRSILSEISDKEPIPPKILPYCKSVDELAEVAMHRIIISTCISSGSLYRLGLKAGHISHVFVDEAGQASEPEIMVSLGLISTDNGQIILAGDPMQLGPVIRSPFAEQLQESYLHRLLLSCSIYQKQKDIFPGSSNYFNPMVVTQLLNNYRAHPLLLKLPSELFYESSLIPCVLKTRFIGWKWLPNPQIPLIFNGVRGKEFRNSRNPSTYNPSESVMVIRWIGRLLQDSEQIGELEHCNISVITPYRSQVDNIRKLIRSCLPDVNLAKLKVASVEEFQGQENEVVIISTVRSSLDDDCNGGIPSESCSLINTIGSRLGFLSNKRRFNVSITRACSLLIVIGDPVLLQYDECWNALINYAKENKAYCGAE